MYSQLNNADEVVPKLWIGDMYSAQSGRFIKDKNIKAVLNLTPDVPNYYHNQGIEYMRLNVNDSLQPLDIRKMSDYLPHAISFIYKNRDLDKKNVLVHCHAGRQRSATCVAAYLKKMNEDNDIKSIIQYLIKKRPQCFHFGQSVNFWQSLKDL